MNEGELANYEAPLNTNSTAEASSKQTAISRDERISCSILHVEAASVVSSCDQQHPSPAQVTTQESVGPLQAAASQGQKQGTITGSQGKEA